MPPSDAGDRRARLAARATRRLAAFGVLGAVVALERAWLQTLGAVNCSLRRVNGEYCLLFGVPEALAYAALALPAAAVGVVAGLLVPPSWTARARATRPGRLAFAPSNGTLLALPAVLAVVGGGGLLLFFGHLTARVELWLLLAVPVAPFLLGTGAAAGLDEVVGGAGADPATLLAVALAVLVGVVATAAQALWLQALAAGLARAAGTVGRTVRDR